MTIVDCNCILEERRCLFMLSFEIESGIIGAAERVRTFGRVCPYALTNGLLQWIL